MSNLKVQRGSGPGSADVRPPSLTVTREKCLYQFAYSRKQGYGPSPNTFNKNVLIFTRVPRDNRRQKVVNRGVLRLCRGA